MKLILIAVFLSMPMMSQKQDNGPSYQDTTNWIVTKMTYPQPTSSPDPQVLGAVGTIWYESKPNVNRKYPWGHWDVLTAQSFKGCTYTYTVTLYSHYWKRKEGSDYETTDSGIETAPLTFSVDLSKVSPNVTFDPVPQDDRHYPEVREYSDSTHGGNVHTVSTDGSRGFNLGIVNTDIDATLPTRIKAAFSHAITLCGGKPEAF